MGAGRRERGGGSEVRELKEDAEREEVERVSERESESERERGGQTLPAVWDTASCDGEG
jgi:hypothetical protein